jgi:hypothetical protein
VLRRSIVAVTSTHFFAASCNETASMSRKKWSSFFLPSLIAAAAAPAAPAPGAAPAVVVQEKQRYSIRLEFLLNAGDEENLYMAQ